MEKKKNISPFSDSINVQFPSLQQQMLNHAKLIRTAVAMCNLKKLISHFELGAIVPGDICDVQICIQ